MPIKSIYLNKFSSFYLLYFIACLHFFLGQCSSDILRGVPLARQPLYDSSKAFQCLDGAITIPSQFVNDDYCDCPDGTDEPGTAACPNGVFHCLNKGHSPQNIPSSRVNDGICDCCDGSDEYLSSANCPNNCYELGQQAREEAERQQELYMNGYTMYQSLVQQGQQILSTYREQLQSLKEEEKRVESEKLEKEAIKAEAEAKEKAALAKYESEKEAEKKEAEEREMKQHMEEEKQRAEEAFKVLDKNGDGLLTVVELQEFPQFDTNKDGDVSQDEAKFFLHMKEEMDLEEFVLTGWMIMRPIYLAEKQQQQIVPQPPASPPSQEDQKGEEGGEEEAEEEQIEVPAMEELEEGEEEEEEDEDLTPPEFPPKDEEGDHYTKEPAKAEDTPVYDEQTQNIVNEADEARKHYTEASDNLRKIQDRIQELENNLNADYGHSAEFAVLKGQCFEYNDREYTYRMCPFDSASQNPKSGGSSINLGRWGHWAGPEGNKYSLMRMDGGLVCWNGPPRSVIVELSCGLENKVTSTTEPNRCEYHMEFTTPAMCSTLPSTHPSHEEL